MENEHTHITKFVRDFLRTPRHAQGCAHRQDNSNQCTCTYAYDPERSALRYAAYLASAMSHRRKLPLSHSTRDTLTYLIAAYIENRVDAHAYKRTALQIYIDIENTCALVMEVFKRSELECALILDDPAYACEIKSIASHTDFIYYIENFALLLDTHNVNISQVCAYVLTNYFPSRNIEGCGLSYIWTPADFLECELISSYLGPRKFFVDDVLRHIENIVAS